MNTTLKNSHGGYAGRTIIQRIEAQMDKRRKRLEALRIKQGVFITHAADGNELGLVDQTLEQGRYEGFAASLALLRSSSMPEEISRSNERLGIE